MPGVYLIRNIESGKGYVGQTRQAIKGRWREHRNSAFSNEASYATRTAIARAMRKYGLEAFEFSIIEECPVDSLDEREVHWIARLGTFVPSGYNMTTGGGNGLRAPEIGAKISAANKGRRKTPEWRAKLSAAHKGKKLSEAQKAQISAVQKGRKQSPETIEKRRLAMVGKNVGRVNSAQSCANIAAGMTAEGKARTLAAVRARVVSAETREKKRIAMRLSWARKKGAIDGSAIQQKQNNEPNSARL